MYSRKLRGLHERVLLALEHRVFFVACIGACPDEGILQSHAHHTRYDIALRHRRGSLRLTSVSRAL